MIFYSQLSFDIEEMKARILIFGLILTVSSLCGGVTIPKDFPRCYSNDPNINDCLLTASNSLNSYVRDGIPEMGIVSFNPVVLPYFEVNQNNQYLNFTATLRNFSIRDMYKYDVSNIRFNQEGGTVTLEGKILFGNLSVDSRYVIDGEVVKIPVKGNGTLRALLAQTNAAFKFTGRIAKNNDAEYIKIIDVHIGLTVEDVFLNFSNLFDDEKLGEITNKMLNQMSKIIAKAGAPVLAEIFEQYLFPYLKWLTKEIPYHTLFPLSKM